MAEAYFMQTTDVIGRWGVSSVRSWKPIEVERLQPAAYKRMEEIEKCERKHRKHRSNGVRPTECEDVCVDY